MTEPQTAAPDVTADPVWRRLVMDAAAFQRVYDTPAHLAEFAMQLAALAFARGMRHQQLNPDARPQPLTPTQIVAEVMDHAAQRANDSRLAALHAFAHASQRAHAAAKHAGTTGDGEEGCGGDDV